MSKKLSVAILGSTGYVGLELIKILYRHPNVNIIFLGSENYQNNSIKEFDSSIDDKNMPLIQLNKNFDCSHADTVFLSMPHGISNKFAKKYYDKVQIIDLSADFRLDEYEIYKEYYNEDHLSKNLLNKFIYGLPEINIDLQNKKNIAIPGCYPTSILIPLVPLLKNQLINETNIIIDSKSGYSGAGKKFDLENIKNSSNLNFYNYNTNNHRHISEIRQELNKASNSEVSFSFNPHILPNFRGMMSTIYCDLSPNINKDDIIKCFQKLEKDNHFVEFINNEKRADFFSVQNTNKCLIKIFKHYDSSKIIIVSLIDNLLKGAAGQAVQCFNLSLGLDEWISLEK